MIATLPCTCRADFDSLTKEPEDFHARCEAGRDLLVALTRARESGDREAFVEARKAVVEHFAIPTTPRPYMYPTQRPFFPMKGKA